MSIESVMPSNHLILCCPLLLLLSIFSSIRVFSNKSVLHIRQAKLLVSALVLPMNIKDWFPLGLTGWISLQSKGPKNLLQYSSKASIFWHSDLFMVQVSHMYLTPGKTIVLTLQTFVSKVKFLLFNMLSGFVIAFLPRNKHLLISWLQSPSTVINYYAILNA